MSAVVKPAKHSSGRRLDVLRVLRAADSPMSIAAIADMLDVHPNTVRFHLDTLFGTGRVEQVATDRKGPGRPALMFRATRRMDPGGARHYQLLAEILAMGLAGYRDAAARALSAGREWGRRLNPPPPATAGAPDVDESIEHLVGLLDELGFDPERRGDEQLGLRNCPFLELVEIQKAIICPIHLGLMQGALETWAAPVTADRLDTFVEPDLCLVHLTRQITAT
ncbi:MAG: helix-turn-helix domain-containing protein [Mycobacterium sp.]|uniref:helix-turn-helix transcriptional regulator n=1 Tax=Mycobacterium sp. TaxID=1785 RepID=UPI003BAE1BFE